MTGLENDNTPEFRERIKAAVPTGHQEFIRQLAWVCELRTSFAPHRLIAVHSGLNVKEDVEPQLQALRARDSTAAVLQPVVGRFEHFSGKKLTQPMPDELIGQVILVSGHHAETRRDGDRFIVDSCGGRDESNLDALILPERMLITSGDADGMFECPPF